MELHYRKRMMQGFWSLTQTFRASVASILTIIFIIGLSPVPQLHKRAALKPWGAPLSLGDKHLLSTEMTQNATFLLQNERGHIVFMLNVAFTCLPLSGNNYTNTH